MEKEKIMLDIAKMPTEEIEEIISFGKNELEMRNNREWLKAVNEVMTAVRNLKNRFPCATCYVEHQVDDSEVLGDFDLLELFETVTEDSFQQ